MSNNNSDLVSEKLALSNFFTSLLTETDDNTNTSLEFDDAKVPDEIDTTVFLPDIPEQVADKPITIEKPVIEEPEVNVPEIGSEQTSVNSVSVIGANSSVIEEPFQIMMFKTAGLTLAVPLVELSGVITWPENLTEMPGHTDSYLGLVQHQGRKVPIIDIAKIVFPQDRVKSLVDSEQHSRLHRIVFINDFEWGLACDVVNDVITIEPDQIKWRKPGATRAWLAGTVVEYMCALLNIEALSSLLKTDHG